MIHDPLQVLKLNDLLRIEEWQDRVRWRPFFPGVQIHLLYETGPHGPRAALLRFAPGGRVPLHEHVGYEHIVILSGSQVDENSRADTGAVIINPPGTSHSVLSEGGCLVLAIYERPVRFLGTAAPAAPDAPARLDTKE